MAHIRPRQNDTFSFREIARTRHFKYYLLHIKMRAINMHKSHFVTAFLSLALSHIPSISSFFFRLSSFRWHYDMFSILHSLVVVLNIFWRLQMNNWNECLDGWKAGGCIRRERQRDEEREHEILQRVEIKNCPNLRNIRSMCLRHMIMCDETCASARPMILNFHSFGRFPATTVALRANTNFIQTHTHMAVCVCCFLFVFKVCTRRVSSHPVSTAARLTKL